MNFSKSGGLEKQTDFIVKALIQKGFHVHFVTTKGKSIQPSVKNLTFHFLRRWPVFSFFRILFFERQAAKWLKKNKMNVVLGLDRTTLQTHIRAGNGVHKTYLKNREIYFGLLDFLLNKINPLHHLVLSIEKRAFQNPALKKIIVNSNMVKSEIIKWYNVDPNKIVVIHNGVEWKKNEEHFINGFKDRHKLEARLKVTPDKFNLLFVGNGFKRKGLNRILIAFSKIENDDLRMLVVGKDKKLNRYKKLAENLRIGSKVTFFGQQPSLDIFYQISDALILPSYYDPFSNATIEALSMGLMTITSKENGAHEIINENNGIIINDLTNIEEIKQSIEKVSSMKKNFNRALLIRDSIKHLDIINCLDKIISTLTADE